MRIIVVLDRSGSMANRIDDTIGSFNTFLAEQQSAALAGERMTLAVFSNNCDITEEPIALIRPLTRETYIPSGGTALNDAIVEAISTAGSETDVIMAIITDGGENQSRKATADEAKSAIVAKQALGWDVHYLGVGLDLFTSTAIGATYGTQTATPHATIMGASASLGSTAMAYRATRKPAP